jgi:hypothetical protein
MKLLSHTEDLPIITYSLYEVAPKIYAVQVTDDYDRAMLFLRAQEYYESAFSDFRGRNFNIFAYMNRYRKHWGKDHFSYPADWSGYNVPSNEVEGCYGQLDYGVDMVTPYDEHMMNILWQIRQHQRRGNFYLLGVDSLDSWVMDHEMAHARFFTDPEYKAAMTDLMKQVPTKLTESLNDFLIKEGYPAKVLADETQAYLATGLHDGMNKLKGIKTWEKKFSKIFKQYNGKQSNNTRAKQQAAKEV